MGYTPRDTYGGGSSESRESVQGNRERIERDRDRDRNNNYSQRKTQQESEAKAKAEAERKAQEAERRAQEQAERKAKAKAEKEAREEAEASIEGTSGFSPIGGLSSYGLTYANGGRGILANMRAASNPEEAAIAERINKPTEYGSIHFREPTQAEKNAGAYTNETAYTGQAISQDTSKANIARLTGDAIDEKGLDIATDFVTSPAGIIGKGFAEVSKWARDLFDDSTDWEKAVKGQAKKAMSGNGFLGNVASGVQGTTMLGSLAGNGLAQSLSPIVSSTPVSAIAGVADDAYALNNWIDNNRQYLEANSLLNAPNSPKSGGKNDSRQSKGILANMRDNVTSSVAQQTISQTDLPEFEWASGDDFNFNYGMGFKRNA
ncbi:hypothetical protein [Vibrio diazotrophicus]|uniref:hypothetical protein n=1 Tax=Vibrio diazotrophicus TaxID=685 RepID=UPI0005A95E0D|nr:hypothetical protein [Vibrio diazotrophicus]